MKHKICISLNILLEFWLKIYFFVRADRYSDIQMSNDVIKIHAVMKICPNFPIIKVMLYIINLKWLTFFTPARKQFKTIYFSDLKKNDLLFSIPTLTTMAFIRGQTFSESVLHQGKCIIKRGNVYIVSWKLLKNILCNPENLATFPWLTMGEGGWMGDSLWLC